MNCPICGEECDKSLDDNYHFCWGCDWGEGDPVPQQPAGQTQTREA